MAKVYPSHPENGSTSSVRSGAPPSVLAGVNGDEETRVLTVWCKSLLFNCRGFAVFDGKGNLVFRVDNYASASCGEIVLMDASGKSLLTVRRKRLSLGVNWLIYHGDETVKSHFSVKKRVSLIPSKGLATVTSHGLDSCSYSIVGSYSQRRCTIYDGLWRPIGEVRHKEATSGVVLGGDVFRLIVLPGFDASLAMAMIIALEQMFQ